MNRIKALKRIFQKSALLCGKLMKYNKVHESLTD